MRLLKRDSQQPRPASSAFGSAGSRIISIPICRRERKKRFVVSLAQPIHPSRPSTKDALFFACCLFSPRIFHITISSGSRQPHLICHYGRRRRIQRDPFEPLGGEAPESKDARKLPAVAFRPFISLSLSLCGESGATHTDKRLLLIICLCECTISGAVPFYSFGGCVRLNAFVLAGEKRFICNSLSEKIEKSSCCSCIFSLNIRNVEQNKKC